MIFFKRKNNVFFEKRSSKNNSKKTFRTRFLKRMIKIFQNMWQRIQTLIQKTNYDKKELDKCKSEEDYNKLHQQIIKKVASKSVWANTNEESQVIENKIKQDLPDVCKKCIQTEVNKAICL